MKDARVAKKAPRILCALGSLAAIVAIGAAAHTSRLYTSPDGRTIAAVSPAPGTKTGEGEVHIRDAAGLSRMKRSFASSDGEHGLSIAQAAWSPDSGFFVFSGSSSGGHQPWHSSIFVYSRVTNALYELDDCVAGIAVVEPDFAISSPHQIRVAVADFSDRGLGERYRHETYNLRELVRKCRDK